MSLIIIYGLLTLPIHAQTLEPEDFNQQLASFQIVNDSNNIVSSGAAIPFRYSNDSLYVVTANHLLQGVNYWKNSDLKSRIKFYDSESWLSPTFIALNEEMDIAVFVINNASSKIDDINSLKISYSFISTSQLESESKLFALGCRYTNCWHQPEEARFVEFEFRDTFGLIKFKSPFLGQGMSGGPLVNSEGILVGMILSASYNTNIGEAILWESLSTTLEINGYTPNFYEKSKIKHGDFLISLNIQAYPLPAKNRSGNRLFPGIGFSTYLQRTKHFSIYFKMARHTSVQWTSDRRTSFPFMFGLGLGYKFNAFRNIYLIPRLGLNITAYHYLEQTRVKTLKINPKTGTPIKENRSFIKSRGRFVIETGLDSFILITNKFGIHLSAGFLTKDNIFFNTGLFLRSPF